MNVSVQPNKGADHIMDLNNYTGVFIDETNENLQKLNEFLLAFEEGNQDVIKDIFRVAHTLKGMSATMGFKNMAALTHVMEDVLDGVRNGKLHLRREEDISLMFECLDILNLFLDEIKEGKDDSSVDISEITANLKKILEFERSDEGSAGDIASSEKRITMDQNMRKVTVKLQENCMLKGARAFMVLEEISSVGQLVSSDPPSEKLIEGRFDGTQFTLFIETQSSDEQIRETVKKVSEILECTIEKKDQQERIENISVPEQKEENKKNITSGTKGSVRSASNRTSQTVRVDVQKLDKLLNLVGELVIGRSRIERLANESDFKEFEEPILQLGRISKEIQELVTKLRMLPISFIFDRFPRLVRDLSHSLEKKVTLQVEGRETELDRSVIDEIGDPMVHLIRNSLDHGLECPEERLKKGKKETGILKVRAYQDGRSVVVAVEDDGKGIDRKKLLEKAIQKEMIKKEQADNITDLEAFQFLFVPGFSTSEEISDVSGRGVGLDAVKNKVESLGGRISVESEPNKGTSVKVKLPITLAIVLALLVRIDEKVYAIPLESVDETLRVDKEQVNIVNGSLVTMLRGAILNLVDSRTFYGLAERDQKNDLAVVVIKTGFRQVGFIVDDFIGQQEIVIKNLGNRGKIKIPWFSGGTILGDGSVALIIDPAAVEEVC